MKKSIEKKERIAESYPSQDVNLYFKKTHAPFGTHLKSYITHKKNKTEKPFFPFFASFLLVLEGSGVSHE